MNLSVVLGLLLALFIPIYGMAADDEVIIMTHITDSGDVCQAKRLSSVDVAVYKNGISFLVIDPSDSIKMSFNNNCDIYVLYKRSNKKTLELVKNNSPLREIPEIPVIKK